MDDREPDLAETTAELSETLDALRAELDSPPRGPLGLPRPPTPAELLRFTEQYTIPAVVALLEAAIRSLELLGAVLRAADGRPIDAISGYGGRSERVGNHDRIAAASRETLRRLDDALADLQSAARGEPSNPELKRLLAEARELSAEVDARLSEAVEESGPETGTDPDSTDATGPEFDAESGAIGESETGADAVGIDVDEELASIKQDVAGDADGDGDSDPDPNSEP
jgi:hypothetical protein